MSRRVIVLLLAILVGAAVLADLTWEERREDKLLEREVGGHDRFVDMGVVLRVVRMDLEHGAELIPGKPPLAVLREHHRGGIVDTRAARPCFVARSQDPVIWYCSEDQEPLILHGPELRPRVIAYGSEGGGKTAALVRWHVIQLLKQIGLGHEAGQTAPTSARMERFHDEAKKAWRSEWLHVPSGAKHLYNAETGVYSFVDGSSIRCVSTHQPSKAEGARVQGYSWVRCGSDELQDHLDKNDDIEARGRDAPCGVYFRFATATAKDSPSWRTFRDRQLLATNKKGERLWSRADLLGRRSPFVSADFWDDLEGTLSPREYERRVLARDVGPEHQLYSTWQRDLNLRTIPQIGAADVTAEILQRWADPGRSLDVLVGHDPGKLCDVSVLLKAYRIGNSPRHVWFVIDEVTTDETREVHAKALVKRLREKWNTNLIARDGVSPGATGALVRTDPYSDSGLNAGDKADRSILTVLRQHGLQAMHAVYAATTPTPKPGTVPREAGIEMVCGLLCNAKQERRLFVACDDRRMPSAPRLVESFETAERDEFGKSEQERKDRNDVSHWPAALRYALWVLERPRLGADATGTG